MTDVMVMRSLPSVPATGSRPLLGSDQPAPNARVMLPTCPTSSYRPADRFAGNATAKVNERPAGDCGTRAAFAGVAVSAIALGSAKLASSSSAENPTGTALNATGTA